jgi:ribosomal protein S27AE
MTTIKATCPGCGEVDLVADDILLRIGARASVNTYGFTCPTCSEFVEKHADERVIRLLLSGGVMPTLVHVPAEILETRSGPPINYDDLLTFHEKLESEDWFDQLLGNHRS